LASPCCRPAAHAVGKLEIVRCPSIRTIGTFANNITAACATIVNDRTNLHFRHIAEHLNSSNTELAGWLHRMASRYIQSFGDPTAGQAAALKKLWEAAYREAQVQAHADAYLAIAVCFVVSAMMVPLMRGITQNQTGKGGR
jgi:hypothetical protein